MFLLVSHWLAIAPFRKRIARMAKKIFFILFSNFLQLLNLYCLIRNSGIVFPMQAIFSLTKKNQIAVEAQTKVQIERKLWCTWGTEPSNLIVKFMVNLRLFLSHLITFSFFKFIKICFGVTLCAPFFRPSVFIYLLFSLDLFGYFWTRIIPTLHLFDFSILDT